MNPEGSQIITRPEFASTVNPGTVLEMNIILRKDSGFQANREKCPRPQCGYINLNVTATYGWIEWKVPFYFAIQIIIEFPHFSRKCFARFQAAKSDDTDDVMDEEHGNYGDRKSDEDHGEICPRPHCGFINFNVIATHGWIKWKVYLCVPYDHD
jgi:hypothetical protein